MYMFFQKFQSKGSTNLDFSAVTVTSSVHLAPINVNIFWVQMI